ncbi:hypothetical protein C8J57DRAFT_572129 [Mycena rebaudengoi]|nr:hypothetical protein C8J57DRAFT_572129 [Mycena rebaudengoi]
MISYGARLHSIIHKRSRILPFRFLLLSFLSLFVPRGILRKPLSCLTRLGFEISLSALILDSEFERVPAGLHKRWDYAFASSPLQTAVNIFLCYWSSVLDPSQILKLDAQKV